MRLAPMSRAVGTNGKRTESKSLIIFHYSQNLWLFWMDSSKMFINSLNIPKGSKWENVQQSFTQMVDRSRDSTHHKTKSMPPKKDAISKRKQSSKQWPQQKYRRNKGSLYHWCPSIWPYESLVIILFWGIGWWYLRGWLVMQLVHNYHHKGFNLDVTMMFMTETTIMKLFSWGLTGGRLQFSWLPLPPFRFEGRPPPFPKQRRKNVVFVWGVYQAYGSMNHGVGISTWEVVEVHPPKMQACPLKKGPYSCLSTPSFSRASCSLSGEYDMSIIHPCCF